VWLEGGQNRKRAHGSGRSWEAGLCDLSYGFSTPKFLF
jgi:hypothetical protein